ncbi:MAG: choice-of-anchor B domain-containing protein, partial [Limisphaerales bacterium]
MKHLIKTTAFSLLCLLCSNALTAQLNISLLGQRTYSSNLSDIWGYSNGSNEYALVGVNNGLSIVDVTTPTSPSEVQFISGPSSTWRDIKTWGNYAYVTNENSGGLSIVDLSGLPGSAPSLNWTGGPNPLGGNVSFSSAHNIFIDENGIGYIVGANYLSGGAIMIDLAANPINPPIVGVYNTNYCHDIYVRNDVMYTAEIYAGQFAIVDISNKLSPVTLGTQSTPSNFTHNTWLSDDGNYLYTTDETGGASVTSFDVSDPTDINQLDRLFSTTSSSIPHNTFINGDFVVTAHYTDGVRIADATDPSNLIETGYYDTSPSSGSGYNGCWGVYPYLPSGIILATDQSQGLFILNPTYSYALSLQGSVTDASSGGVIFGATVQVVGVGSTTTD